MTASQLKRLKASLRAAGITGEQNPKKKAQKQNSNPIRSETRVDQHVKLQSIREEFNPFEIKKTKVKHEVIGRGKVKGTVGKPSLSKQIGEENRKRTLLVEMQMRNKTGGIIDRRFGENDPTMPPEERMLERFTREKQSRLRNGEIFNLENDDDDEILTHFGQSLGALSDLDEDEIGLNNSHVKARKRLALRMESEEGEKEGEEGPPRKKPRNEVMKEIIAKSKIHKEERQRIKEADELERERLDAQMGDIWKLLAISNAPAPLPETSTSTANEEGNIRYDETVRELVFDKRAQPSDRTKTAEEKAQEESERLKELEKARQKRMQGEEESENEGKAGKERGSNKEDEMEDDMGIDHAAPYGLGRGISAAPTGLSPDELVDIDHCVDDTLGGTDEYSGSDVERSDDYNSEISEGEFEDEEDEDFLVDVLPDNAAYPPDSDIKAKALFKKIQKKDDKFAFTFPCPQTHQQFIDILKDIPINDFPMVIQRIRILFHPQLQPDNKSQLANFAVVLLDHIMHITATSLQIPFGELEIAIRHLHALTKQFPEKMGEAFRQKLELLHKRTPSEDHNINAGDLIMLTCIASIFPTSDHFHPVVTPANLVMTKYLSLIQPPTIQKLCIGTYIVSLCMQYQQLSKRLVPELMSYILRALSLLSPSQLEKRPETFLHQEASSSLRLEISSIPNDWVSRKLGFAEIFGPSKPDTEIALFATIIQQVTFLSTLWAGKKAFFEIFSPVHSVITHLSTCITSPALKPLLSSALSSLDSSLGHAILLRRPLELHHHRPLPIPSNIPKFEEGYSFSKRYDPDRERAESNKLKAQYKKERKGALRELRKDASFIAREKLKEEKEESRKYHEKMRRLHALIQSEEGAEKNKYEREKRARKGKY